MYTSGGSSEPDNMDKNVWYTYLNNEA